MQHFTKRVVHFIQLMEEPADQLDSILNFGYFLAVSSDTLLVINHKDEILDSIRKGEDNDGLKLGFLSEDNMLDAIHVIKQLIDTEGDVLGFVYENAAM